jgi:hypothetical protein
VQESLAGVESLAHEKTADFGLQVDDHVFLGLEDVLAVLACIAFVDHALNVRQRQQ